MKKILALLLIINITIHADQESNNPNDSTSDNIQAIRATLPPKLPIINFTTPFVFNPNLTPNPTQPARIANVSDLLVYIAGATENGPFGSVQSTINQINAINNTNIGVNAQATQSSSTTTTAPFQANANQIITNSAIANQNSANQSATNQVTPLQNATNPSPAQSQNQSNALVAVGIAASGLIGGTPSSTIQTQNLINQQAAFASATNNASQAANQIKPNQSAAGAVNNPIVTNAASQAAIANQTAIANPNPFVTINNPTPNPKIVSWNAPLIIDHSNVFFNTQSVVRFEENIIYNPGAHYNYPEQYSDYPAAIIIAKDNITIDLAGFDLSLAPRSATNFLLNKPTYGISILPGVKNVKIVSSSNFDKPGSISGFSGYAVYGSGDSQSFTYNLYANMIQNIIIENILMSNNLGGIFLENALQLAINLVSISYSFGARDINGIYLNNVYNGFITNCKINQNHSYLNMVGIHLIDTISIAIDQCAIDNNRSIQTGDVIGIVVDATNDATSHDNKITNCSITGNLSAFVTGKESIGINIKNGSYGNAIESCSIFGQSHGPSFPGVPDPTVPPVTYGIKLVRTFTNQILKNQIGYNGDFGIYDSTTAPTSLTPVTPTTPVSISTSFFTNNVSLFNTTNYWVTVPTVTTFTPGVPISTFNVTTIYAGNTSAYIPSLPILQNISVELS